MSFLVLIAGGHSAGKRTVARDLLTAVEQEVRDISNVHLTAIDLLSYQGEKYKPEIRFDELMQEIARLESSNQGISVVFVHGNYALYNKEMCDQANLKIFLDTDADTRLSQWIMRDTRGAQPQELADILQEYLDFCRPEYENYIEATKKQADVLLPHGSDQLTMAVLSTGIMDELLKSGVTSPDTVKVKAGTPMINLRAEVASDQDTRYYAAN